MTKADLVDEISGQTGISRQHTGIIVDQLLDAVCRALSEGRHLEIRGFGTFKVRERRARRARQPPPGPAVMVPAKHVTGLKPRNELKAQVLDGSATPQAAGVA